MRIDPSGHFNALSGSVPSAATSKTAGSKEGKQPTDAVAGDTGFSPTTDLTRLLQAVQDLPDVRADVVRDVTARAGELLTPAAATDTAVAILDAKSLQGN